MNATSAISSTGSTIGRPRCVRTGRSCPEKPAWIQSKTVRRVLLAPRRGGEPAVDNGLSAHGLSLGVVCQAPAGDECVTGATQYAAWATMYGATVTLSDPTPPTLGTPSGALWGPGEAGGFHKGTESVTVSADDVGGGVASIVLSADGRPVETYTAPCNFTFAQPCPSSTGAQTLTLPTTQLSDGTHTLDARRNRCRRQSIDRRLAEHHRGEQRAAAASGIVGHRDAGGRLDIHGHLERSRRPGRTDHGRALPSLSGEWLGLVQRARSGTGGWAGDRDGAWPWKLEHRRVADQCGGQREPRHCCAHQRRRPAVQLGRLRNGPCATGTTPTIHVTETLRGRELVVHVSGAASGKVRVRFTGRLRGRTVASGAKTVALRHGRLTVIFRLGPRTAAHALIRVSAKLDHELAVTSTLPRHAPRRGG